MKKFILEKNRYVDSVTLMGISGRVKKLGGIEIAEIAAATPINLGELKAMGFDIPDGTGPGDLAVALSGRDGVCLRAAEELIYGILNRTLGDDSPAVYRSLEEIDLKDSPYDLVQISLPGEYAFAEAKKALERNMDVFIFSDNVPIEQEKELKELGASKGLLVMGPDCGVGLIGGVALAAGSIVRKGPVGIVGASGSGAQEVACIVERCGLGVSAIIGTGGRDLTPAIGGSSMLQGMKRLDGDPDTKVIVLVSKLADTGVMGRVLSEADKLSKPVAAVFLGGDGALFRGHRVRGAFSLEEAALTVVELCTGKRPAFGLSDEEIAEIVKRETAKYGKGQKYLRALFCGGTFTEECLLYFSANNPGVPLHSNLKTKYAERLSDHSLSVGHTVLDLGAEDFTEEAPHPIFDPMLRLKRFSKELADPSVAVVLIDFIAGPGVHPDPVTPFADACREAAAERGGAITFIANVCGSLEDPQDVPACKKLLRDAGVIVAESSFESARIAGALLARLFERG